MIITTKLRDIVLSIIIVAITICSTIIFTCNKVSAQKTTESTPKLGMTVVLDAGHGGIDPGSIGRETKVTESELNLTIVKKVQSLLESSGIDVVLTRKDENGLYGIYSKDYKIRDMKARKEIIESSSASLVVSVHMNSFVQRKYRGAQVFYDDINNLSSSLALAIQNCFSSDLPESDKGTAIGDYYILKCVPTIPTVLCECGYLSNAEDEKLLISEDYQNILAYSIYKGIISYLNT